MRSALFSLILLTACASAQDMFLQGVNAEQKNNSREALDYYAAALAKDPSMAKAYNNRGLILYKDKQYQDAITEFDQALKVKPDYAAALSNRGLVLEAMNDPKAAMAQYEKAVSLDPKFPEAYFNAGALSSKNGDLLHAIQWLEKANELKADDGETLLLLGRALLVAKNYGRAAQMFDALLKVDPNSRDAFIGSVDATRLSGNQDVAAVRLNQYVAMHPDCALCSSMLGAIYTDQKKYDSAIEVFEKSRQYRPGDPTPRYHLGFLYFLTKNKSKSIENLEEFLKLKGDFKDAQTEKASQMLAALKKGS